MPPTIAFIPGSLGPAEVLVLFVVILVLFGPRRLPEVARMIGKTLDRLRRASMEFRDQIMHLEDEENDGVNTTPPEAMDVEVSAEQDRIEEESEEDKLAG